jgi:hypothetical protein
VHDDHARRPARHAGRLASSRSAETASTIANSTNATAAA